MRLEILQLSFILLFSSCDSTPADITECVGSDVNIPWEYPDSAGMNTVSWVHNDSSNNPTTILAQASGSLAMVIGGYNIQHNTNGDVTITTATVANSGTYRITVAYSTSTPTFTDDVVVNVYDPPTGFSFTESPSGSQTTFTCAATSLGDPAANLYIQVNGVDMTSSVSATVSETDTVKCILSGSSVQCMSGVSGTVTSICVQCPSTEAPTTDETSDTDAIVGGTVGGVLGFCGLVAAAVVGIRHLNKIKKGSTTTLTFVEGSEVTFSCPFPESVTFPEWRGPPGFTIYTILDDTSGTINSKIPAFNRLQCASNKRDLILSNAVVGDSGDYKCSYTGQGDHTFTLKVNRANCTGGIDLADNGQLLQENPV